MVEYSLVCLFQISFCCLPVVRHSSSESVPAAEEPTRESIHADQPGARVQFKGNICSNPREAETNLLNFLTQSDVQKRKAHIEIPFFVAGSILAVTRADPYSYSGETRFVGICIARQNNGIGSTFTLRNVVNGVGVEVMFETYSPTIKKIEVLRLEKRRRAKLYYLRDKPAKESTFSETLLADQTQKLTVFKRKRKKK